jgi:hypothetical protein
VPSCEFCGRVITRATSERENSSLVETEMLGGLIYYAITNMAAIKMTDEEHRYPRSIAWLGLISCLFLAFWVELMVWATGLGLIAIGLLWWRLFPAFEKSRF